MARALVMRRLVMWGRVVALSRMGDGEGGER